jgi:Cu/Ag efflux pump CusA
MPDTLGFLVGIMCRNGIMMISHYIHLMQDEDEKFDEHMIVRGSLERLTPVLMTALTAIIGFVPLAMGADQTGQRDSAPVGHRCHRWPSPLVRSA